MKRPILYAALDVLSDFHKKKGIFIILMLIMNSTAEFFTVVSFLPVIFLVINPDVMASNEVALKIGKMFNVTSPTEFILFVTSGVMIFVLVKTIVTVFTSRVRANYIFSIGQDLSNRALENFMECGHQYFVSADYSKEINRISNQPLIFSNNIILPLATIISESLIVGFFIAFVTWYNVKIVFLLSTILLPILILYAINRKRAKRIGLKLREIYPLSLKYSTQAVEGFIEIKTSGTESFFKNRFKKISKSLKDTLISDHISQAATTRITEIIAALTICSLIAYSVLNGDTHQQTLLLLSIYAGASYRIIPSINRIMNSSLQLRTHEYVIGDLKALTKTDTSVAEQTPKTTLTFNQSISLRDVGYRYEGGPVIFDGLTITFKKGQKIAITGNSGEGKSTLLLMLMGLIKPIQGQIFVDDRKLDHFDTFKPATFVSQNPYILDASVAENIAFGIGPQKIDRSKIMRLVRELDLISLISQLPQGIDSVIGEKGIKLSGGQRQRLAIARALYADGEVLLFDEITNQLHTTLESEVMNLLDRLASEGRTIVMVTHKVTNWDFFDSVYRLEKGLLTAMELQH
jgi:ATP-binding cassette, subfamily B, bacterial PglK